MPGKLRIVYVAPMSPDPPTSGGALRIEALRRALGRISDAFQLVVLGDRPPPDARKRLRTAGAVILPPRRETFPARLCRIGWAAATGRCIPSARYLSERRVARLARRLASWRPDVIVLGEVYMTPMIPALAPLGARIVVDTHDAASRVHARIGAASRNVALKLGFALLARDTRRLERRWLPQIDQLWTVSEEDAEFYRSEVGLSRVEVMPNVVEFPPIPTADEEEGAVVFTGSFGYWPNEDAALRLVEMTRALASRGVVRRLYLVGISPTERMRRAAAGLPHVVITGRVPEVTPYLLRAQVVAAPLSAGSGTRLKIVEAMANARPVLTTPVGAEGLGVTPGVHAEVVPLDRFGDALVALLRDPARRAALAREGRAFGEARYSPAALEARLRAALGVEAVVAPGRGSSG